VSGPILVTGAAGFAGSHLVEHLAAIRRADGSHTHGAGGEGAGNEIVAWARTIPTGPLASSARWQQVDLLDRDAVRTKIRDLRPSAVYHCAGFPHASGGWADVTRPLVGNLMLTHYLFDALRLAGAPCRVVLPGSATVYATSDRPLREDDVLAPKHPYALSKLAQEQLGTRALAEDGLNVILTRSFNHTGPRQTAAFAAPSMARQIALIERGELEPVVRVGNLDARRDLIDVRDAVAAYSALMRAGVPGTVYNVASGVGRTIAFLLDGLIARARVPVRVEPDRARMRPDDTPVLIGDAARLHAATGWAPAITFDRMLDDLLEYWRNSPPAAA
jgi:GDP-4-dehydro-6-deoxy-D-mannose reductase